MGLQLEKFHNGKRQFFTFDHYENKWKPLNLDQACKTPDDCNGVESQPTGCLILFVLAIIVLVICYFIG